MKSQGYYFRRKNSKRGLALSTAMAICIVLAILVAVLVSMASLNITTTQSTVNQREAYITAKSALAFAESYYSQHDIPGKGDSAGGKALIVFNSDVISNGAKVYVIQDGGTMFEVNTAELKEQCKHTYVDVVKSGNYLDLTANCKYGDGDIYQLSKEFSLAASKEDRPNSFTGNVSYQARSDTRYLHIHVRTNPAFGDAPLLWAWYTTINPNDADDQYGRSSIVNKLSGDTTYASVNNGEWNTAKGGPVGNVTMQYEGNGWYVTELAFSTNQKVHFVNAIVTRAYALRSSGNSAQSWELFGIPVPDEDHPGENNAIDVYITLNRNQLRDARNYNGGSTDDSHASEDEFTHIFEKDCNCNINDFAKFCGSWYTVYEKKNTSTMHYRKQGVINSSAGPGGNFEYEGYGWWRQTIDLDKQSASIGGFDFSQAAIVDQNEYGKEVTKEGFVCEFSDGSTRLYETEEDANRAFIDAGDKLAGNYLTVNVKSAKQPVDRQIETKIEYFSKYAKTAGAGGGGAEPTANTNDNLEFSKLASTSSAREYAVICDTNNWGRDPGVSEGPHYYEKLNEYKMQQTADNTWELTIDNIEVVQSDGKYHFKVIEMKKDTGSIDAPVEYDAGGNPLSGWSFSYGAGIGDVKKDVTVPGSSIHIKFVRISDSQMEIESEVIEDTGDHPYMIVGFMNNWGKGKNNEYSAACFQGCDNMHAGPEDHQVYFESTDSDPLSRVQIGETYTFKVIEKQSDEGVIENEQWKKGYPSLSSGQNFEFTAEKDGLDPGTWCNVKIIFNTKTKEIVKVELSEVVEAGMKQIRFYNGKGSDESNFVVPWENFYYNAVKEDGTITCTKYTFTAGTKTFDFSIPEDTKSFFFSNMEISNKNNPDYQRTQPKTMADYNTEQSLDDWRGKYLTPKELVSDAVGGETSDAASGKWWTLIYRTDSADPDVDPDTEVKHTTETMVYTGSNTRNYYDAPIVKILIGLIPDGNKNAKYGFAAYPYKNKTLPHIGTVSFDNNRYVTYQGEKYYYTQGLSYSGKYSFLIAKKKGEPKDAAGGIILENHLALMTDTKGGVPTKMSNRAGGAFTSDDENAIEKYNGYTPNWYTFKIPVTTTAKIAKIEGVDEPINDGGTLKPAVIMTGADYFETAKIKDDEGNIVFQQPVYVSQEYANTTDDTQTLRFYTYNTKLKNVDTSTEDTVSVYFANDGNDSQGAFSGVSVYAYDLRGNSTTQKLDPDPTDGDNHYYVFTFPTGKYCYFRFFETPSSGNIADAEKKTAVLYLSGEENEETREYNILAKNGDSTQFEPFLHPRTAALYAYISLEAASRAGNVPKSYSFNQKTGEYKQLDSYSMGSLETAASNAKTYWKNGNSGVWNATNPTANMELARTIQKFVRTLAEVRIYISDDAPAIDTAHGNTDYRSDRLYKEGSYRDDTFKYQTRWVNRLTAAYDDALSVFDGGSNSGQQGNAGAIAGYITELEELISAPILDWNSETVQIIVDDQRIKDKNEETGETRMVGGWGKANLHLWYLDEDGHTWKQASYDLYDTTQSNKGFYAYVFKLNTDAEKFLISKTQPADGTEGKVLEEGKRYTFYTSDVDKGESLIDSFKADESVMTYKITDMKIEKGTSSGDYNAFSVRDGDNEFALNFVYDCTVKHDGDSYVIRAGVYRIRASYAGYNSDLESLGQKGIDLYSSHAKAFFTNPLNYGMSEGAESLIYSEWNSDILDSGENVNILCNAINHSGTISATTSETKKLSLRYKANRNDDTLKLTQNVALEGGTIVVSANHIDLNGHDMTLKAKTIVFTADTTIITEQGEFDVIHGTYALNEDPESGYTGTVSLQQTGQDPDWREFFTLLSDQASELRGGYYIDHV